MTNPVIGPVELARRLCLAVHPHIGTTGSRFPCGNHVAMAQNSYGLLLPEFDRAWEVFAQARAEARGVQTPCEFHDLPLILIDGQGVHETAPGAYTRCPRFVVGTFSDSVGIVEGAEAAASGT